MNVLLISLLLGTGAPAVTVVVQGPGAAETKKTLSQTALPVELRLSADPALAARELYSEMRRLAESGADLLFVRARAKLATPAGVALPEAGLWDAIWDRLTRAASLNLDSH